MLHNVIDTIRQHWFAEPLTPPRRVVGPDRMRYLSLKTASRMTGYSQVTLNRWATRGRNGWYFDDGEDDEQEEGQ